MEQLTQLSREHSQVLTDLLIREFSVLYEFLEGHLSAHPNGSHHGSLDELQGVACCFGEEQRSLNLPRFFTMNRVMDQPPFHRIHSGIHKYKELWKLLKVRQSDHSKPLPEKDSIRHILFSAPDSEKDMAVRAANGEIVRFHRLIWDSICGKAPAVPVGSGGSSSPGGSSSSGTSRDDSTLYPAEWTFDASDYPAEVVRALRVYCYLGAVDGVVPPANRASAGSPRSQSGKLELKHYYAMQKLAETAGIGHLSEYYAAVLEDADRERDHVDAGGFGGVHDAPAYWTNRVVDSRKKTFFTTVDCPGLVQRLEAAMNARNQHCSCSKTFRVHSVKRVENSVLLAQYYGAMEALRHRRGCSKSEGHGGRKRVADVEPRIPQDHWKLGRENFLEKDLNEVYLFHGTNRSLLSIITQEEGFDERLARDGLYGQGIYAAENACKSHQYTDKSSNNVMILCRVLLGNPMYTDTGLSGRRPLDTKKFDSVIANKQQQLGRFQHHREFIVYDRHQIYPEFIINYS